MDVKAAIDLITEFGRAEIEATHKVKATAREKAAAKALLKALCPQATNADLECLLDSLG